ncbi:MAG TPA: hypothetical protein PLB90_06000 [Opitutaceae bacterium]|nr:hypothetical protein [Opitutaceae bacterium]
MVILIGIGLALAVGVFAQWFGLDRDRAFYPTVMIVIAFLYVLFAAIGGGAAIPVEAVIGLGFATLAAIGFKKSGWFVVVALVGHGLFDVVHPHVIDNAGVPVWWPAFCAAYDVTAGVWLGQQLYRARSRSA